jgi:hypothetical protein
MMNYRMSGSRDTHEAELKTMNRIFADVMTTGEIEALLTNIL